MLAKAITENKREMKKEKRQGTNKRATKCTADKEIEQNEGKGQRILWQQWRWLRK